MSVSELKAGLLMRRFRSSVFCGREELLNLHKTIKERGKKHTKV